MRETTTHDDWIAEATRRFGEDAMAWAFECPVCKHVATVADWKKVGASEGEVAFSCIGRHIAGSQRAFLDKKTGPCDYAGGGLFRLNPVTVTKDGKEHQVFAFAPTTPHPKGDAR